MDQIVLRNALLAAVPADGTAIGNQSLLEKLRGHHPQLTEDSYRAVRDTLIDEGLLAKGRGRGGAVRRASPSADHTAIASAAAPEFNEPLPMTDNTATLKALAQTAAEVRAEKASAKTDKATARAEKAATKAERAAEASSTLEHLEKTLWAAACKLWPNMDAAEYKHIVLGLIFLKYISDSFASRRAELERRLTDPADDYYLGGDDTEALVAELEDRDYSAK